MVTAASRDERRLRQRAWLAEHNEQLNAVVDEVQDPDRTDGVLGGLAVTVKANIARAGRPLDAASAVLDGYRAPDHARGDATCVARLKAAGAVIVGTTNMDEFGMGGTTERSVTLSVSAPPPPPRQEAPRPAVKSLSEMVGSLLADVYFDYDKSDVREDGRSILNRNAEALKQIFAAHPSGVVTIEGHCDERGSAEYNLGLGDRRSTATKDYLVNLGIPAGQLKVISYGNEKPTCSESNESCWQKNRRAHFSAN